MVLDNRGLNVHELADMVGISKSAVYRILTENLDMRKLCARWVPHLHTMEQKERREMFQSNIRRCFTTIKLIICVAS